MKDGVPRTQPIAGNWLELETKATCSLSIPLWLLGAHFDGSRGTSLLLRGGVPEAQGSRGGGQDRPGTWGPLAT